MFKNAIIVTGNFPPEDGGPAKFAQTFSTWISSRVDSVKVLSTTPKSSQHLQYSNVEVLLQSRKPNVLFRYLATGIKLGRLANRGSLIIANGCFLEVFFSSIVFRFSYLAKVPGDIVWERARTNRSTTLGMREYQSAKLPIKTKMLRFLFTRSLMRAKSVIVPSTIMRNVCLAWGIPESKIRFIPNSVNSDVYRPDIDKRIDFDVITVSRLIGIKKIEEIIEVCAKFGLSLLIVGDGPEEENLRRHAKNCGGKVVFHGGATQEDLPDLYRRSKYFILNSEFEAGTPYALLEARSCALVCIANRFTGCADVITDSVDGYLVDENDKVGLEQKVSKALIEESKYSEFSILSRQDSLNRFSEDAVYSRIFELMTSTSF